MKTISVIIGTFLSCSAIDTIDFYTTKGEYDTPTYLWYMLVVGLVMVAIPLIHALRAEYKGGKYDVYK